MALWIVLLVVSAIGALPAGIAWWASDRPWSVAAWLVAFQVFWIAFGYSRHGLRGAVGGEAFSLLVAQSPALLVAMILDFGRHLSQSANRRRHKSRSTRSCASDQSDDVDFRIAERVGFVCIIQYVGLALLVGNLMVLLESSAALLLLAPIRPIIYRRFVAERLDNLLGEGWVQRYEQLLGLGAVMIAPFVQTAVLLTMPVSWGKFAQSVLPYDLSAGVAMARFSTLALFLVALGPLWLAFRKSEAYLQLFVVAVTVPVLLSLFAYCIGPAIVHPLLGPITVALLVSVFMCGLGVVTAAVRESLPRLLPKA